MMIGSWGCASRNNQQNAFNEYRKLMERQKTALIKEDEEF
jgi:hypothetical protein